MNIPYRVYDVFADSPFAGTQIAVVYSDADIDDGMKSKIVSEFSYTDTVFLNTAESKNPFSVFNDQGKTTFGAHTTLAAAQAAHDLGLSRAEGGYFEYDLQDDELAVNTFIDNAPVNQRMTLFSRSFSYKTDHYVPTAQQLSQALSLDEKHLRHPRYSSRLVSVDAPVLIVPVTQPEHIVAARLDGKQWSTMLSELYARYILLIAQGSVSGRSDFHGRLIHPYLKPQEYPPIGSVMPEFIGYLCSCDETTPGTHTVTIDRGSYDTRQSLIHIEFDYDGGDKAKCRIGGRVVLMSEGQFVYQ